MTPRSTPKSTSPAPVAPGTVATPRAAFTAAAFAHLRAAAGDGQGEALRIPLADIDEDASQPRTVFAQDELEGMAETIRSHGVVQPVVVRAPVQGRYLLVFGARRLRASRLAGMADIPAVVRPTGTNDLWAQVIENQHRTGLCNSDLSAAIERLVAQGASNRQIGSICALKDYQVAAFRQVSRFPSELAERMNHADIRALYDLYRQWTRTPDVLLAALPEASTFLTVTEARRIIGGITGQPTGSLVLDRARTAAQVTLAPRPTETQNSPSSLPEAKEVDAPSEERGTKARHSSRKQDTPVFIVAAGDRRTGSLVLDRRATRSGLALVAYATGVEEVEAAELRIMRID